MAFVRFDSAISPRRAAFSTAIAYMFTALVLGGGAGIWLPAAMPDKHVGIDALTTFVMAILAPIFADLLLDYEVYGRKLTKLWRMTFVFVTGLTGVLSIVGLLRENAPYGWDCAKGAVVLSLVVWLFLALKTDRFLPTGDNLGSIGGDRAREEALAGGGLPQ